MASQKRRETAVSRDTEECPVDRTPFRRPDVPIAFRNGYRMTIQIGGDRHLEPRRRTAGRSATGGREPGHDDLPRGAGDGSVR